MNTNKFLFEVHERLENSKNAKIRLQLKTILKRCGDYSKRSQKFVDRINNLAEKYGIILEPKITVSTPTNKKDWVNFTLIKNLKGEAQILQKKEGKKSMILDFKPYPHQTQAWNHMDKHYTDLNKTRGMVILPTGAGKTTVATQWLIKNYLNNGFRVLWLAHRVELLEQAMSTFENFSYSKNSMIILSGEYNSWSSVDISHDIAFSTDKSAALNIPYLQLFINQSKKGVFVVVDEAHHSVANQYQNVIKASFKSNGSKQICLLGLTATPVRMNPEETQLLWRLYDDNFDIGNLKNQSKNISLSNYGSKIYEVSQTELINNKILSKPVPITINTEINFEKEFTEKDYKHLEQFGELGVDVLSKLSNSSLRNEKIVKYYKDNMDKYGKTIVFAVDIAHCITLNEEFKNQGVDSNYVVYGRQENADIIKQFKDTKSPQVLISVIKLTEGFDAPNIQSVFITRPTKSEPLIRQMIGRGLRGVAAGGTDEAYLVTFVDTWQMFKPISAGYIIDKEETELNFEESKEYKGYKFVPICEELIKAAYELLREKTTVDITGIYQALPYSWYQWTVETEEEEKEESIIIFSNQYEAYEKLKERYENDPSKIPDMIDEEIIEHLIYMFFGDCQDPLPNYYDIMKLLSALKKKIKINKFTFEEKKEFDPFVLADRFKLLNMMQLREELEKIFFNNELCRHVYRNVFEDFYEEVSKEIVKLYKVTSKSITKDEETIHKVMKPKLGKWRRGLGYDLEQIMKSVLTSKTGDINKRHFPNGRPIEYGIMYTNEPVKTYFGICRYSDKMIKINNILDSPDIPRFVLEFLVYHELLHTDLPNNGHDKLFRERERNFIPSEQAETEAKKLGFEFTSDVDNYWYVVSNQFLDTIHIKYDIEAVI